MIPKLTLQDLSFIESEYCSEYCSLQTGFCQHQKILSFSPYNSELKKKTHLYLLIQISEYIQEQIILCFRRAHSNIFNEILVCTGCCPRCQKSYGKQTRILTAWSSQSSEEDRQLLNLEIWSELPLLYHLSIFSYPLKLIFLEGFVDQSSLTHAVSPQTPFLSSSLKQSSLSYWSLDCFIPLLDGELLVISEAILYLGSSRVKPRGQHREDM